MMYYNLMTTNLPVPPSFTLLALGPQLLLVRPARLLHNGKSLLSLPATPACHFGALVMNLK
jgi:hypothetical protein